MSMKSSIALVLLILLAAPASAQPAWATHLAIGAQMTSAGADLAVTSYGLGAGAFREANPVLRPFESHPVGMAIVKMGLGSALSYALIKHRHTSRRAVFLTAVGLTVLNSYVASRNSRMLTTKGRP